MTDQVRVPCIVCNKTHWPTCVGQMMEDTCRTPGPHLCKLWRTANDHHSACEGDETIKNLLNPPLVEEPDKPLSLGGGNFAADYSGQEIRLMAEFQHPAKNKQQDFRDAISFASMLISRIVEMGDLRETFAENLTDADTASFVAIARHHQAVLEIAREEALL